jgi:hypothetical protein
MPVKIVDFSEYMYIQELSLGSNKFAGVVCNKFKTVCANVVLLMHN